MKPYNDDNLYDVTPPRESTLPPITTINNTTINDTTINDTTINDTTINDTTINDIDRNEVKANSLAVTTLAIFNDNNNNTIKDKNVLKSLRYIV